MVDDKCLLSPAITPLCASFDGSKKVYGRHYLDTFSQLRSLFVSLCLILILTGKKLSDIGTAIRPPVRQWELSDRVCPIVDAMSESEGILVSPRQETKKKKPETRCRTDRKQHPEHWQHSSLAHYGVSLNTDSSKSHLSFLSCAFMCLSCTVPSSLGLNS